MLQNETQQPKVKSDWPEVLKVLETKRYELTLIGSDVSKRIENDDNQLPDILFKVKHLNFLEIAKTSLENLSDKVKGLENLSSLMLHTNKLKSISAELGSLKHLSHLDMSNNQITTLPSQLQNLSELKVINLSGNLLAELFPLKSLSKLAVLNISRNRFALLPVDIGSAKLENLSQIDASFNQLVDLTNVDIVQLPSLKQLNLENNLLNKIPPNLCKCERLKEILLKNNKLQDNRLRKLVDQDKLKAVIEYLERIYVEESKKKPSRESIESNKKGRKSESNAETAVDYSLINILHSNTNTAEFPAKEVFYADSVTSIRPYIACCIVRNLDFKTPDNLKKFLALQTRLHEDNCQKRTLGTIATHDLSLIKGNLYYEANDPNTVELLPLGRQKQTTAFEYYQMLMNEAEIERKAKKRNQLSGVYKYLNLLENKETFPVLKDAERTVISLPPLTNSEKTRMTTDTTDVFIEITSTHNLEFCKKLMENIITEILNMNLSTTTENNEPLRLLTSKLNDLKLFDGDRVPTGAKQILIVQQVKIIDAKGNLKCVYPSRVDLTYDECRTVKVTRLYNE